MVGKYLFSVLATAGILIGNAGPAHSDTPTSFHPVSGWVISKMPDDKGAAPRCLMISEYNNGFFVQFQGYQGKIEAISIDMRQQVFTAGQTLDVQLEIPGKPVNTLTARAFKPETLVINMNGQDQLFTDLRSASALDMRLADNNFRFFMTGFANSLKAYDACLNEGATLAAASPETQIENQNTENMPAQEDDAPELSEPVEMAAAEELVVMEAEPAQALEPMHEQKIADNQPVETPAEALANEQGEKSLIEDLQDFVTSNDAPPAVLASASTPEQNEVPPFVTPAPATNEADLLPPVDTGGETNDSPMPVSSSEAARDTANESESIDPALSPIPETEPSVPAKPVIRSRIQTPDIKVTTENTSGNFDMTEAREVSAAAAVPPSFEGSCDASALRREIEMLRAEKEALDTELKLALRASENERLEVSSDNWNLESATMKYNEAERQIASLGQQIQKERAECSFEKKELEMMLFDPQVTEEAQLARLSSLEKQLEAAKKEIEALRSGAAR